MNHYILLVSTGILGPIIFIVSVFLSNNSHRYSINWPGNEKWDLNIRKAINLSFRNHSLNVLFANIIGIIVGLLVWKLLNYDFNTALILSTIICIGSALLSLVFFMVKVPVIVKRFK